MSDTAGEQTSMSNEVVNTQATSIQRAERGHFAAGRSANPLGRPRGARSRATLMTELLYEGEAGVLTRKAIELALSGDTTALRMCIDRLSPRMKSRPMSIDLPAVETPADIGAGLSVILDAAACGDIDADQARIMAGILETKQRNFEAVEMENRLSLVEKKVSRDNRAI